MLKENKTGDVSTGCKRTGLRNAVAQWPSAKLATTHCHFTTKSLSNSSQSWRGRSLVKWSNGGWGNAWDAPLFFNRSRKLLSARSLPNFKWKNRTFIGKKKEKSLVLCSIWWSTLHCRGFGEIAVGDAKLPLSQSEIPSCLSLNTTHLVVLSRWTDGMSLVCCTFCSHGGRPAPMHTCYLSALTLPLVYLSGPLKMSDLLSPLCPVYWWKEGRRVWS